MDEWGIPDMGDELDALQNRLDEANRQLEFYKDAWERSEHERELLSAEMRRKVVTTFEP